MFIFIKINIVIIFFSSYIYANGLGLINTISELSTFNPRDSQCVYVRGYNIPDDGGGGLFCYDRTKINENDHGVVLNGWVRQFNGSVNIKWFGANVNRVDNQIPIQFAINYGEKVNIDNGTFLCNDVIKIYDKNISIEGESRNSILLFTKNSNGISIQNNVMNQVNINNLSIKTNILSTKSALSIIYRLKKIGRHHSTVHLSNLYIAGSNINRAGWMNGIVLDEVTFPIITDIEIYGRKDLASSKGKKFWGHSNSGITYISSKDLSPVNPLFNNIMIKYVRMGFNFRGRMEGLRIKNCLVIATMIGLYDDRSELGNKKITIDPWLYIDSCHFNTAKYGVYTKRSSQSYIINSLFYQFPNVDMDYTAIKTAIGNDNTINNNIIIGNKKSQKITSGIIIDQNNRAKIESNSMIYISKPFIINKNYGKSKDIILFNNIARIKNKVFILHKQ